MHVDHLSWKQTDTEGFNIYIPPDCISNKQNRITATEIKFIRLNRETHLDEHERSEDILKEIGTDPTLHKMCL
jgi:hypothetical protein